MSIIVSLYSRASKVIISLVIKFLDPNLGFTYSDNIAKCFGYKSLFPRELITGSNKENSPTCFEKISKCASSPFSERF